MSSDRIRGERNAISSALGLHILKRRMQKRFLAQQCKELTNCIADAIAATVDAAPVRVGKRYIHDREASRETRISEANWEEALFRQFASPPAGSYAPWERLLSYQVSLQDHKTRERDWGEIDLLGVSKQNLPVIVELKAPASNESPAQMLVQATAYAVAIQKAWPTCLREEWAETLGVDRDSLPETLTSCELVCAAPTEYWDKWVGDTPRARTVSSDAWAAIAELRKSLAKSGYPSSFVRLSHQGAGPTNISVVEEQLPEG
jgi:hypothetical protein